MTREVEKRCPAAGKQQAMDGMEWDGTGRDGMRCDASSHMSGHSVTV